MANAIYTIYLAIRIADADNCPQNLATFGVQTNIKSILLTLNMVCSGTNIGFNEYFHMFCGLQLFLGPIAMPWWLVGACCL